MRQRKRPIRQAYKTPAERPAGVANCLAKYKEGGDDRLIWKRVRRKFGG